MQGLAPEMYDDDKTCLKQDYPTTLISKTFISDTLCQLEILNSDSFYSIQKNTQI